MSKINLTTVQSGYYSQEQLNENFQTLEKELDKVLFRDGTQPNHMQSDLDMNGYRILNSSLTEKIEALYEEYKDKLTDLIDNFTGEYQDIDDLISDFQDSIANLQAQLSGDTVLEASAFSPISWHSPFIKNSVTIPAHKNGWSFGPYMSITSAARVTIKPGSTWTIANGQAFTDDLENQNLGYDEGYFDGTSDNEDTSDDEDNDWNDDDNLNEEYDVSEFLENFDAAFDDKTTDDLSEGVNNLYHTGQRAVNAIKSDIDWKATNWDTAYSWGNHAQQGYLVQSDIDTKVDTVNPVVQGTLRIEDA